MSEGTSPVGSLRFQTTTKAVTEMMTMSTTTAQIIGTSMVGSSKKDCGRTTLRGGTVPKRDNEMKIQVKIKIRITLNLAYSN